MSDDVANQESAPSPTLDSETKVFLKTAGGGQSDHIFRTYRSGLTYFKTYLQDTQAWQADRPIATLLPDRVQEFPLVAQADLSTLRANCAAAASRKRAQPVSVGSASLLTLFGPAQAAALL